MSAVLAFLRRGPISPWMHWSLDYPLAAVLIAGPLLLDFDSDTATIFILAIGGAATVLAVGTNWSHGIIRVIPPVLHGMLDSGAGLVAILLTRFESDLEPSMSQAGMQPAL
jgi:hypothetical protein